MRTNKFLCLGVLGLSVVLSGVSWIALADSTEREYSVATESEEEFLRNHSYRLLIISDIYSQYNRFIDPIGMEDLHDGDPMPTELNLLIAEVNQHTEPNPNQMELMLKNKEILDLWKSGTFAEGEKAERRFDLLIEFMERTIETAQPMTDAEDSGSYSSTYARKVIDVLGRHTAELKESRLQN